jgi:hypothetical protein
VALESGCAQLGAVDDDDSPGQETGDAAAIALPPWMLILAAGPIVVLVAQASRQPTG